MIQNVREVVEARQYEVIVLKDHPLLRVLFMMLKKHNKLETMKNEEFLAFHVYTVPLGDKKLRYYVMYTFKGLYLFYMKGTFHFYRDELVRYDEIQKIKRKEDEVWLYRRDHAFIKIKTGRITESVYEILQAIIRTINGSQSV